MRMPGRWNSKRAAGNRDSRNVALMAASRSFFFPTDRLQTGVLFLAIFAVHANTDGIGVHDCQIQDVVKDGTTHRTLRFALHLNTGFSYNDIFESGMGRCPPIQKLREDASFHCRDIRKFPSGDRQTDGLNKDVPEFGGPIKNVTITVGREATLECIVDNLSTYKVAWLRVDTQTILTIAVHVITKNHRIAVANSDKKTWFLHIREVKESDRGWYMCQINTDPMKSQVGYLEVVVPPDILDYPTSTDMVVREGNNVTLQCVATGFPPPTIVWKREQGEPILLGNGEEVPSVEGSVFTITRVNRLHMGAYLCIASNKVPPSVSKRIMLIVHFPPMIWIQNQLVGAQEGQSMTLQCHSEAFPKSINYWTRNGDTIAQGLGGKYEPVLIDNAYKVQMKLTIKSVTASDYGSYKCISRNSLGETDGEIKLYHIPKPTTSTKPSTTTKAINPPPPPPPIQQEKDKKPGKTKQKQRERGKERRPAKGADVVNEVVSETDRPPKEKGIQLRSEKGGRLQADSKLSRSTGGPSTIPNSIFLCLTAVLELNLNL